MFAIPFGVLLVIMTASFSWFLAKSWLTTPVLVVPTAAGQTVLVDGELACSTLSPPDFCGKRIWVGSHTIALTNAAGTATHTTTVDVGVGWGQRLLWTPAEPEGFCVVRGRVVFSTGTEGVSGHGTAGELVRLSPGLHDVTGVDYVLAVPNNVRQRDKSDVMREVVEIRSDCP